jgi:tetratricopeptide (TPR) repeat protein
MERWEEAERAFSKALERDLDHAAAHRGMAATQVAQERYIEAIDSALRAVELERNHPYSHYYLGAALAGNAQTDIAVQVFLTCLELDENHLGAHKGLITAYEKLGYADEVQKHQEHVKHLESAALLQSQLRDLR